MNPRPEKVAVVAEVKTRFEEAEAVVLTEYRGLDVGALAELRGSLRAAGGDYKVYKNTMVRLAVKDLDFDIDELLVGPTAIAFTGTRPDGSAGDAATVAKALTEFGQENESLIIKGGLLDGEPLSLDQIKVLSKLPGREALLARLAGGMAAPMQQFAALLNAVTAKFAYALQALIDAGGAPGAPEPAPAESAEEPAADEPDEAVAEEATLDDEPDEAVAEDATPDDAADAAGDAASEEPAEEPAAESSDDTPPADGSDDQDPAQSGEDPAESGEEKES